MTVPPEIRPFVKGAWVDGESTVELVDKYHGRPVGVLHRTSRRQTEAASRGVADAQAGPSLHPYERFRILARASELLQDRTDLFTTTMVADGGFTVADARREVQRAAQTLLLSGEEAKRVTGEMVPLEGSPGVQGRLAFTIRRPLGVVCAITPFNSPLNTVAHKIGPALAAGNGVVLKPASYTPMTADLLLRLLLDAGLPEGHIAVVYGGGGTVGEWLLQDPVPQFYAFTGSTEVGRRIRATIGLRRCQLELGSLSSTIICDDANLERSAALCVDAAFRKAGQVCTSIQRLYVQRSVVPDLVGAVTALLRSRKAGDPSDPTTFVGPLISDGEAARVESWIRQAVESGAEIAAGGRRTGAVIEPTVLTGVTTAMNVMCQEAFGPVLCIRPFDELPEALDEINQTPYGLAAGVFTADIARALAAAQALRMGSVHINESSSSRVDAMPYGGVKDSGMGTEGPRYAIREMTEERLVTIGIP